MGYQEGDVIPKTENIYTTMLSKSLMMNGMNYEAIDITEQTYELLKTKRISAITHQKEFEEEGYSNWFDILISQTECATETFEQFKEKMARYIYVIGKHPNIRIGHIQKNLSAVPKSHPISQVTGAHGYMRKNLLKMPRFFLYFGQQSSFFLHMPKSARCPNISPIPGYKMVINFIILKLRIIVVRDNFQFVERA